MMWRQTRGDIQSTGLGVSRARGDAIGQRRSGWVGQTPRGDRRLKSATLPHFQSVTPPTHGRFPKIAEIG